MRILISVSAHKDLQQILDFCQLPFTKGKKFVLPLLLFSTELVTKTQSHTDGRNSHGMPEFKSQE